MMVLPNGQRSSSVLLKDTRKSKTVICILQRTGKEMQLPRIDVLALVELSHSTGGLVLKRALVRAMDPRESKRKPSYRSIIKYCHTIAFFGTPRKNGVNPLLWVMLILCQTIALPRYQTAHAQIALPRSCTFRTNMALNSVTN
jgi:hypothetical protein